MRLHYVIFTDGFEPKVHCDPMKGSSYNSSLTFKTLAKNC